jgi:hypothetical protein
VRAAFLLLLFANLAFVAWAEWIDVPQAAASKDVYAKLPRLKLIGEEPGSDKRAPAGSARKTAMEVPAPPASQCLSVGPFDDQDGATRGASLLREKGLTPRQRTEQGEISKGFWVYIGGLKTDRDVAQVLGTLQQSHVDDAMAMQDTGEGAQRVSVGLFSERDRADRRAQSVEKLGLQPVVVERKVPATVLWMDVDVPPGATAPAAQDLGGSDGASAGVEVRPCPNEVSQPVGPTPLPAAPGTATTFHAKVAGASGTLRVP